jgi:CBS domain-containing protein
VTHGVKRVPVIHVGKLVGIITRTDVVRALAKLEASKPVVGPGNVALQKAVLDKIRAQTWLDTAYISVEMANGGVRLTGFIGSDDQRRALRVLAEEVCGADKVKDDMTVGLPTLSEF